MLLSYCSACHAPKPKRLTIGSQLAKAPTTLKTKPNTTKTTTPLRVFDGTLNMQAGALVGTINGYPRAYQGGYFPLITPMVSVQYGAAGANIFIIPPFKGIPATAALQIKVGF